MASNAGIERYEHTEATGFLRLKVEASYLVAVGTETLLEKRLYWSVSMEIFHMKSSNIIIEM